MSQKHVQSLGAVLTSVVIVVDQTRKIWLYVAEMKPQTHIIFFFVSAPHVNVLNVTNCSTADVLTNYAAL